MSADKPKPDKPKPETPIVEDLEPWMIAMSAGMRGLLAGLTRVRIEGAPESIPRDGPLIIASNHASNLDVPVIASHLMHRTGRRWQWLGKRELFDWPIVGTIAVHGGVHAVDRDVADVEAYRLARRILDEGHVLFVFPEDAQPRRDTPGGPRRRRGACPADGGPDRPDRHRRLVRALAPGPEAAAPGRSRHRPGRFPVPTGRRAAGRPRPQGRHARRDGADHAPHRRAAPARPAWPLWDGRARGARVERRRGARTGAHAIIGPWERSRKSGSRSEPGSATGCARRSTRPRRPRPPAS